MSSSENIGKGRDRKRGEMHKPSKFLLLFSFYLSAFFAFQPVLGAQATYGQALGERISSEELKKRDIKNFGSSSDRSRQLGGEPLDISPIPPSGPGASTALYYTVHVLGEVYRPGSYRVLPSDRVVDALQYAGGILLNGSERMIQLRREGGTRYCDMMRYKLEGNLEQNPYIMENDVIFVPVRKGQFQIEGPVNRPGTYEWTKNISLSEVVRLAGGFSVGVSVKQPIRIIRYGPDEKKEVIETNASPEELKRTTIVQGDVIVIPHVLISEKQFDYELERIPGDNLFYPTVNDSVYVVGHVDQPGAYPFKHHYSFREYMNLAGPLKDARTKGIKILRADGKKMKATAKLEINPGDTIIVPAKAVTTTNIVYWFSTLTNMALTTFVFIDRFAD